MAKRNVTYIDDLIDLDEVPNGGGEFNRKVSQENLDRESLSGPIKNKIRNHTDFRQAVNGGYPPQIEEYKRQQIEPSYRQIEPSYRQIDPYVPTFNCVDVSNHINNCPICSRLYNDDKTPYLIGMALLVIISIILLKKVIEKQ